MVVFGVVLVSIVVLVKRLDNDQNMMDCYDLLFD